jgi:hypothetical protein
MLTPKACLVINRAILVAMETSRCTERNFGEEIQAIEQQYFNLLSFILFS